MKVVRVSIYAVIGALFLYAVMAFRLVGRHSAVQPQHDVPLPIPGPITIGPVKIVKAHFDYHQTLERPDGTQFEFNHCVFEESLSHEGRIVEITYTGDSDELLESRGCAHVVSVKVIPRKGRWIGKRPNMRYVIDGKEAFCGDVEQSGDQDYRASGERVFKHFLNLAAAMKAVEEDCK